MKVEQPEKKVFRPVVITLVTAEEVCCLYELAKEYHHGNHPAYRFSIEMMDKLHAHAVNWR